MANRGADADLPPGDDGAHALLTADSGLHERDPLHIALEHGEDVIDPKEWRGASRRLQASRRESDSAHAG